MPLLIIPISQLIIAFVAAGLGGLAGGAVVYNWDNIMDALKG